MDDFGRYAGYARSRSRSHPELVDALHHEPLVKSLGDVKVVVLGRRPPLLLGAQAAVERVLGGKWLVVGGGVRAWRLEDGRPTDHHSTPG